MELLVDMNLAPEWADFLTGAGFVSAHWSDVGAPDASDHELMHWALDHGCMVLTADLDVAPRATVIDGAASSARQGDHGFTPDIFGSEVLAAIHGMARDSAPGAVLSIDVARRRICIAPSPL